MSLGGCLGAHPRCAILRSTRFQARSQGWPQSTCNTSARSPLPRLGQILASRASRAMNFRASRELKSSRLCPGASDSAPGVCEPFDDDMAVTLPNAKTLLSRKRVSGAVTTLCRPPPATGGLRVYVERIVALMAGLAASGAIALAVIRASAPSRAPISQAGTQPACTPAATQPGSSSLPHPLPPLDSTAVVAAIQGAVQLAEWCRAQEDRGAWVRVSVTFASSGRVTSAQLEGAAYEGTRTGRCVESVFRSLRVSPFDGRPVRVHKSFLLR